LENTICTFSFIGPNWGRWLAWCSLRWAAIVYRKVNINARVQEIGFGGIDPEIGYDTNVINKYFDWYLPLAVSLGQWFDGHRGEESHVYTTHSFLISLYLACPPHMGLHCPSLEQKAKFREAISKGYITWTAFPWNSHVELMDWMLLQSAVHLTKYIDDEYGLPSKTVASQVCVNGHLFPSQPKRTSCIGRTFAQFLSTRFSAIRRTPLCMIYVSLAARTLSAIPHITTASLHEHMCMKESIRCRRLAVKAFATRLASHAERPAWLHAGIYKHPSK
jgi:hypothetical protein